MSVEIERLIQLVISDGGRIVSSADLPADIIAHKRAYGFMHVTKDGFGLVYMTRKELSFPDAELIMHVVQYVKNECCVKSIDDVSEVDAIKFFNKQYP